jgi:uncharacterized protein (TIGR00290 family)
MLDKNTLTQPHSTPSFSSRAFCSWSGGKDSALALYKSLNNGYSVQSLLTMMAETGGASRSHGLSEGVLRKQSQQLNAPHVFKCASWEEYEAVFKSAVLGFKESGITCGIFGDIDVQAHLDWVARICAETGIRYLEPLWGYERLKVIEQFLAAGFRAIVVACDKAKMGETYLGQELTVPLARQLVAIGVDAAGENGEYHTLVFDGPVFKNRVNYEITGMREDEGYLFLTIE